MSNNFKMVAPSLEMVVLPLDDLIKMSDPNGPNVGFNVSWMARHALMLFKIWPLPCEASVPSLSTTIVGAWLENAMVLEKVD